MSLTFIPILVAQSDLSRKEVIWTAPQSIAPQFPTDAILASLEQEARYWLRLDQPADSLFVPSEVLFPPLDIGEVAKQLRPHLVQKFSEPLPADSKSMPLAEIPPAPGTLEFSER